jgi:WD40 repeat protein
MRRAAWPLTLLLAAVLACSLGAPRPAPPTPTAAPPSATTAPSDTPLPPTTAPSATPPATATLAASATAAATDTSAPSATDTPAPAGASATPEAGGGSPTFLAYVQQGQLVVTNVTGGAVGGTTQYTQAGVNDGVYELAWSPDGQSIAFVSAGANGSNPAHVYVVYAVGAGTPVDLGPGSEPSWSPDSTRVVYVRDSNIWITPVDNPQPKALTAQTKWGWGRPVFTLAGNALVVSGQPYDNMGAQGNTQFELDSLPLDGSGTLTPLPGFAQPVQGRLPIDLSFSPDGKHLAFSTSWHLSACASTGQYYVANADGSGLTQLISQQLNDLLDPGKDFYYITLGYAWQAKSDGLLTAGLVVDCTNFAGTHLGQALSRLDLTNHETVLATGFFQSPSVDHSGQLIAVAQPGDNGAEGQVKLLNATGHPVVTVGAGALPAFQP